MITDSNMHSTEGVEDLTTSDGDLLIIKPKLAALIGLNEGIVFQQIRYWLERKPHEREGNIWVYNTYKEWLAQFPFFSLRTLRRTIKSLEKMGLLVTGNFNKDKTDQKKWYTTNLNRLREIKNILRLLPNPEVSRMDISKFDVSILDTTDVSILDTCTYTENITENITENTPLPPEGLSDVFFESGKEVSLKEMEDNNRKASRALAAVQNSFEMLWAVYPKKVSKYSARKAWVKVSGETDLDTVLAAISSQSSERVQKASLGLFVPDWPHCSVWLNGRRWEDETEQFEALKESSKKIGPKSFKERDLELRTEACKGGFDTMKMINEVFK